MNNETISVERLGILISRQKKIMMELNSLFNYLQNAESSRERAMISSQIGLLKNELRNSGKGVISSLEKISLAKPLQRNEEEYEPEVSNVNVVSAKITPQKLSSKEIIEEIVFPKKEKRVKPDALEKLTFLRIKKKEKKIMEKKDKKPRRYVKFANKFFKNYSTDLINNGKFRGLGMDLIKANMDFVPSAYVSVILFSTVLAFILAVFVMVFFLFFNLVVTIPFIVPANEGIFARLLKVFWIPILAP